MAVRVSSPCGGGKNIWRVIFFSPPPLGGKEDLLKPRHRRKRGKGGRNVCIERAWGILSVCECGKKKCFFRHWHWNFGIPLHTTTTVPESVKNKKKKINFSSSFLQTADWNFDFFPLWNWLPPRPAYAPRKKTISPQILFCFYSGGNLRWGPGVSFTESPLYPEEEEKSRFFQPKKTRD